jgi:adenine/guanine/hypoxanthine permease
MEFINRFFLFERRATNVKTEVIAGITTFLAMSYIIFVNPDILSAAGIPKQPLIMATCLAAAFGTILVGLIAKVPIAMAPGMGLNAFFVYSLVLGQKVNWETALGIVFISGFIFFILSIIGARERLVKAIPSAVIDSVSVGIGLFIAFIGFKNLGLVVSSPATLVTIGHLSSTVLIGLGALVLIVTLEAFRVKGSMLIGIAAATIAGIAGGHVNLPENLMSTSFGYSQIFLKLDIISALRFSFIGAIFSLMFVDMFDSVGTIVACSKEANLVDKDGKIHKLGEMLSLDAVATMVGALFGTSTTTSYIESAAGIEQGGRSGMTSIVTGLLFILAIPLVPLIAIVPGFATAPALIIVGLFMIKRVGEINFNDLETGFPAFMTIILMPLTYSISTGLTFGFISFTIIKVLRGKIKEIDPVMWIITALSVISLIVGV